MRYGATSSVSRASTTRPRPAEWSLIIPCLLTVDVPDPVAEEGPVEGKSTEGSDDEHREQRPYRCSVHAFDGSLPNRHSVEVLMLWGHKAPLCLLARGVEMSAGARPFRPGSRRVNVVRENVFSKRPSMSSKLEENQQTWEVATVGAGRVRIISAPWRASVSRG
jgi:hypothetical protein